jgi:hypothetical protein
MFTRTLFTIVTLIILAVSVSAQNFSIDRASPEVPIPSGAGDIFGPGGTSWYPSSFLDPLLTLPVDEVTSLSFGNDRLLSGPLLFWYSVDRTTVGIPAGIVNIQAIGNGAAGDIFWEGPLSLYMDATANALTPLPPVQSDLDAIGVTPMLAENRNRPYFTLDPPTAAKLGFGPADVLYQPLPAAAPPPALLYAPAAVLGLAPVDRIDGLAIKDKGVIGVLDPADVVMVSLTTGDPTLVANGWSGADIIQVFPGPPIIVRPAAALGLLPTDDVNAIAGYCCKKPGEINGDGKANVGDIVFLINWIFKGGPAPAVCLDQVDVNGDCKINVADAVYMINFTFKFGPMLRCGCVY